MVIIAERYAMWGGLRRIEFQKLANFELSAEQAVFGDVLASAPSKSPNASRNGIDEVAGERSTVTR